MKVSSSSPLNIGSCWPGSNMKGTPWAAQSRACWSMPSRPSGAMIATRKCALVGDLVLVRELHRARVEGVDLVIVLVGRDEALGGVGVGNRLDGARLDAEVAQAREVVGAVLAEGGHDQGVAAQQLQVVGDVRRAAAVFGAQGRHQEGDVDAVQLVGQQGFGEAAVVLHDLVEGERAADQGSVGHGGFRDKRRRCDSRKVSGRPRGSGA